MGTAIYLLVGLILSAILACIFHYWITQVEDDVFDDDAALIVLAISAVNTAIWPLTSTAAAIFGVVGWLYYRIISNKEED